MIAKCPLLFENNRGFVMGHGCFSEITTVAMDLLDLQILIEGITSENLKVGLIFYVLFINRRN